MKNSTLGWVHPSTSFSNFLLHPSPSPFTFSPTYLVFSSLTFPSNCYFTGAFRGITFDSNECNASCEEDLEDCRVYDSIDIFYNTRGCWNTCIWSVRWIEKAQVGGIHFSWCPLGELRWVFLWQVLCQHCMFRDREIHASVQEIVHGHHFWLRPFCGRMTWG